MSTGRPWRRAVLAAALGTCTALTGLLTGCGGTSGGSPRAAATGSAAAGASLQGPVSVRASSSGCRADASTVAAGRHTFSVRNTGGDVTEFYVYAAGDTVVGEVENIGPSTSRQLTVDLPAGTYQLACKPGMTGKGIRAALVVTGKEPAPSAQQQSAQANGQLSAAVASYRQYVQTEAQALLATTVPFVSAVQAGNATQARRLYPAARLHYERIEPVAESFGDLDPLIDMRANDVSAGQPFVGFHRLEQDLYQTKTIRTAGPTAAALLAHCRTLLARIPSLTITPLTMANGAKSLLDEVAKTKVTGEEERYSHIDLVDFAANVEGSDTAYAALRPVLAQRDPALVQTLDSRFTTLTALLATHRAVPGGPGSVAGSPYVSYTALSPAQVKALAVEVDAISEPLGQVSGVVASS